MPQGDTTGPADDREYARSEANSESGPGSLDPVSDRESFPCEELVRSEGHRLRRLATHLLANEHDREDLLQEVWLESVERPPPDLRGVRSWLRVVAKHAASRLGRRTRSRAVRERLVAKAEAERSVLDALEHEAASAELRRCVDGLKDPYREVVRSHFLDDVPLREIAQRLHRPEGTVRSQLKRGLDQLRSRYATPRTRANETGRKRASSWWPWFAARDVRPRPTILQRWGFATGAVAAFLVACVVLRNVLRDPSGDAVGTHSASTTSEASRLPRVASLELAAQDADLQSRAITASSVAIASADADTAHSAGTLAQPPPFAISGRTVDVRGAPVANAEIWVSAAADYAPGRLIAHSDADGRYRSSELHADLWIWAEELDNGLTGRARVRDPGTGDGVPCDLTFGANSGRVSGIVRDAHGDPIVGAQVRSFLLQSGRLSIGWNGEELAMYSGGTRTTDSKGRFEISRILSPRVVALVTADGMAPYATWFDGQCRDELALSIPEAATLEVHARRPDGTPAANIEVTLEHPEPLPSSTGETDANGVYRFERVPPGAFTWIARDPAAADPASIVHRGHVRPGETLVLDPMELARDATIRGTALCESRPLSNWTVALVDRTDATSQCAIRFARTSAEGRFAFTGCTGTNYTLRLRPPDRASGISHASLFDVVPGGPDVRLTFDERSAPSAFVRGTLAEVEIPAGHGVTIIARRTGNAVGSDETAEALADPRSRRFDVGPLPPGEYAIDATHSALGRWKIADVSVHPGADVDLGRLSAPRTGTLRVRWSQAWGSGDERFSLVLDGQGVQLGGRRDIPGARFEVDEAARTIRIPGLLAGSYALLVQGQRIASDLRSVAIEENAESVIDVALCEGAPVDVRVKSPRPLAARESVGVRILSEHGTIEFTVFERPRVVTLDAVAQFRSMLASGANRIEVSTSGGLTGELEVDVRGHEPLGVVTLELH